MPIFQVEIFTPRKLTIVRVAKKPPKPDSPDTPSSTSGDEKIPSPEGTATLPASGGQSAFQDSSASFGKNESLTPLVSGVPASAHGTPPSEHSGTVNAQPLGNSSGSLPPPEESAPLTPPAPALDEERTEKHNEVNNETYEVVFRVERITREEAPKNAEGSEVSDPPSRSASFSSSPQAPPPPFGVTPTPSQAPHRVQFAEFPIITALDDEPATPPDNESATPTTSGSTAPSVVKEETTLDLEEELRLLLLDCIPGVRTVWNRCNSLKNIGEKAEDNVQSFLQVTFYARRKTSLHILNRVMNEIGIGRDYGHVAMTECSYFRPIIDNAKAAIDQELDAATIDHIQAQLEFDNTLNVIDSGASLSFDFVSFLIIASLIAGTGLGVNSTVTVVASMLVSPMMGPILATVMGTVLYLRQFMSGHTAGRDVHSVGRRLLVKGFVAEAFCLIAAIAIGFIVGLAFWDNTDTFDWGATGTVEMRSRTSLPGLVVGMVIAIPSGAGVALSLLGSNGNSLVGVAISASLLPPAVNCGMYFAFALNTKNTELLRLGAYSMCLTLINVVSVYISALLTFYVKRAAPLTDAQGRPLRSFFGISDFDAVTQNDAVDKVEQDLQNHGLTLRGLIAKLDLEKDGSPGSSTEVDMMSVSQGSQQSSPQGNMRRARSELRIDTNEPLASSANGPRQVSLSAKTPLGTNRGAGFQLADAHRRTRSNVFGVGDMNSRAGQSVRPIQGLPLFHLEDMDDDAAIPFGPMGGEAVHRHGRDALLRHHRRTLSS